MADRGYCRRSPTKNRIVFSVHGRGHDRRNSVLVSHHGTTSRAPCTTQLQLRMGGWHRQITGTPIDVRYTESLHRGQLYGLWRCGGPSSPYTEIGGRWETFFCFCFFAKKKMSAWLVSWLFVLPGRVSNSGSFEKKNEKKGRKKNKG